MLPLDGQVQLTPDKPSSYDDARCGHRRPDCQWELSLARATAARLEELDGAGVGVIDLDLIYEMLDPRGGAGRAKNDEHLWSQARRVAGRLSAVLLAEGRHVVVEGNFAEDQSLAEFERVLPEAVRLRLVMLDVDFEIALLRRKRMPLADSRRIRRSCRLTTACSRLSGVSEKCSSSTPAHCLSPTRRRR